ncbi:hypothetical protein [Curtobacterium sp. RIT-PI-V]|uniref:hypothetical protein n=1 Tax=Curtobacterium sp. RIT-PI-V TaxID=3035296 RepID=UPI0021D7E7DF|nr:hypothetical protein [Curtobacterium sp. RIT-PI-V]
MRLRLRLHGRRSVAVLALLTVLAGLVAFAADQVAFPLAPAFPFLHLGVYSYAVWDDGQNTVAFAARAVAYAAAVLCVLLMVATVIALVRFHRSRSRRQIR